MLKKWLKVAPLLLLGVVGNVPALEPINVTVQAVDASGRRIEANGVEYALSTTTRITRAGGGKALLRDVIPGTRVLLDVVPAASGVETVREITVLSD